MKYFNLSILLFFIVSACTFNNSDSKKFLQNYVEYRFKNPPEISKLEEFVTGPAKIFIQNLDQESLSKIDLTKNYNLDKVEILYTKDAGDFIHVAYEVSFTFIDKATSNKTKQNVRKIATLVEENGQYKIYKVENIKTDIDILDAVSI